MHVSHNAVFKVHINNTNFSSAIDKINILYMNLNNSNHKKKNFISEKKSNWSNFFLILFDKITIKCMFLFWYF